MGSPAAVEPGSLRVALLGAPTVTWCDRPLVIPRRQARALLYRLACGPDSVAREHLCYLFAGGKIVESWAMRDDLGNLRQLVHLSLRQG